ncbi:Conserved oligomeric Golgi complex subunit 6 [Armadillidium nasatum]|uniref:Conserved oligomeric Golgi complex subunit 6 n=1 Tax=Armadillidium nasatum TaxID=96803 RepID=A0A5N5SKU8_9CRUS|nr:Conserved oligomeric Golgi complex subunit 6 [Armadillidium nasatum]
MVVVTNENMKKAEGQEKIEANSDKNLNPLSNKISKILDTRLENDKDTLDALKELSTFFKENTLQSRRNLRGQIERRSVGINEEFVNALRDVKIAVDGIYKEVNEMNKECSEMKKKLQMTKSETNHLIRQTNSLQVQSHKLQMQEEVVKTFLKNFQLSSEEMFALKGSSRDSPITSQFFEALNKTQIIRNNTKYLLQTGHQKTALDIMEQMNVARESALERLFRWFQAQTRTPDPSPLIPEALAALQERPVLFKLHLGFLDALTLGGPGGAPKPIELQAHDPLRYVGDMLAWIHQALPSEREAAQLLFSKCVDIDASEQVQQTISGVSESVCRPLKTRIEQVIVSEQGKGDPVGGKKAVHLYKISSLLHFYMSTIKQVTHACDRVEPPGETLAPSAGVAKNPFPFNRNRDSSNCFRRCSSRFQADHKLRR